jgi:hypothetical protein
MASGGLSRSSKRRFSLHLLLGKPAFAEHDCASNNFLKALSAKNLHAVSGSQMGERAIAGIKIA